MKASAQPTEPSPQPPQPLFLNKYTSLIGIPLRQVSNSYYSENITYTAAYLTLKDCGQVFIYTEAFSSGSGSLMSMLYIKIA